MVYAHDSKSCGATLKSSSLFSGINVAKRRWYDGEETRKAEADGPSRGREIF